MKKLFTFLTLLLASNFILAQEGQNDPTFDPGTGIYQNIGISFEYISKIVVQSDSKIIIGGDFNSYNEVPRRNIARLNPNGSLDASFAPGTMGTNGLIRTMILQDDGKIIIGGDFTEYNGIPRNGIARLNTDGSLDLAFDSSVGFSGRIYDLAIQPDGKIIAVGNFSSYNSENRLGIVRINIDGSLDLSFASITSNVIYAVVIKPDGKIVIGGSFQIISGNQSRIDLATLNFDGSLDLTPGIYNNGSELKIRNLILQPDGAIIYDFKGLNASGNGYSKVYRKSETSTEEIFSYDVSYLEYNDPRIRSLMLQVDGKIVVAGYGNYFPLGIKRFNQDGSPDDLFNTNAGVYDYYTGVSTLANQSDGKILIGGYFTEYGGAMRNGIARTQKCGTPETGIDYRIACDYLIWGDGNTYTSNTIIPTRTVSNSIGCDSIVTLNLTIVTEIDKTVYQLGSTLTAGQMGATYQWLDCDNNNAPISGATSRIFHATAIGNYAVQITAGTCSEISDCMEVTEINSGAGIESVIKNSFSLYPNPTSSSITLQFENQINSDFVTVYSISGQKVLQEKIKTENNQLHVNTSHLQSGIYFVEVGNSRMKFVVE